MQWPTSLSRRLQMTFQGRQFAEVAEFLLEESGEASSGPDLWRDIEEARCRSAVSRAYYSLFLHLKERIEPARRDFSFPKDGIHTVLRLALEEELGSGHPLVQAIKRLWFNRKNCDYECEPRQTNPGAAGGHLDDALDAIHATDALTSQQLADLARQIKVEHAELRRRR